MSGLVDLRSDTVTRPTAAMYEAMTRAPVGDDTYGEDPTVDALQARIAQLLGFEAALFVPTGTQGNLCAILAHCGRGDEYIVGQMAHCYRWEGGGAAVLGGVQPQPIDQATSSGLTPEAEARRIAGHFDSVSVCFSKGLGAPAGSVLCGSTGFIERARRVRKIAGGAMRQSGVLAAAAAHALDHHVARLAADHALAKKLFQGLCGLHGLRVEPPDTNIVLVALTGDAEDAVPQLVRHLRSRGVLASALYGQLRLVTHLDVDEADVLQAVHAVREFKR